MYLFIAVSVMCFLAQESNIGGARSIMQSGKKIWAKAEKLCQWDKGETVISIMAVTVLTCIFRLVTIYKGNGN